MNIVLAIIFATVGSVVGAVILWALGKWIGLERISRIAVKMPLVDVDDVHKTVGWFDKHGDKAVFFGRMVPIFRSLISIPAGMRNMSIIKFLVLTTAGSAIWNTILIVAGFYLGENWSIVETYAGYFQTLVIVAVVVFVVVWIVLKIRKRSRAKAADRTDAAGEDTEGPADPYGVEPSVRSSVRASLRWPASQPGCCGVFLRNFLTGAHRPGVRCLRRRVNRPASPDREARASRRGQGPWGRPASGSHRRGRCSSAV